MPWLGDSLSSILALLYVCKVVWHTTIVTPARDFVAAQLYNCEEQITFSFDIWLENLSTFLVNIKLFVWVTLWPRPSIGRSERLRLGWLGNFWWLRDAEYESARNIISDCFYNINLVISFKIYYNFCFNLCISFYFMWTEVKSYKILF